MSKADIRDIIGRTHPKCRVTFVFGVVRFGAEDVVAPGEKLFGRGWLELEENARIVVEHTKTARAWTLDGPALAAFCALGHEEVVLASGTLETQPGPGREATIATPFGRIVYTDARLKLRVSNDALRLSSQAGDAWLTPWGPKLLPDVRISKGNELRRTKRLEAEDAMTICSDAKRQAGLLQRGSPNEAIRRPRQAPNPAFERAVKWRNTSCAIAGAAALSALQGEERESQLRELTGLEQRWLRERPGEQYLH